MSEDLIARLKAAHEALPPSPWRVRFEVSTYDGDDMEGHRDNVWVEDAHTVEVSSDDEDFLNRIALTRNALPEIIAALEERERMRAVVEAADRLNDAWCDAINSMDDDNQVETTAWGAWMKAHRDLNTALDAWEETRGLDAWEETTSDE